MVKNIVIAVLSVLVALLSYLYTVNRLEVERQSEMMRVAMEIATEQEQLAIQRKVRPGQNKDQETIKTSIDSQKSLSDLIQKNRQLDSLSHKIHQLQEQLDNCN